MTSVATAKPTIQPPNVVLVIVDDVGFADVGWNNKLMPTPTLNSLVESEAVSLTNYYLHPTCTPSRAALMTGKYAFRVGLPFPLLGASDVGLTPAHTSLATQFRSRGYSTHLVGKWHLGANETFSPNANGFDSFFGLRGGGFRPFTKRGALEIDLWRNERQLTADEIDVTEHATTLFTNEALKVIEQQHDAAEKPFFLIVSYTAAHDPLQPAPEHRAPCAHFKSWRRREFCGLVVGLDEGVRNITHTLKAKSLWDNTIFVFTTDNGGNPWVGGFNYPYAGLKTGGNEGGVRGPGFVVSERFIGKGGTKFEGLFHIADWYPTLLSIVDKARKHENDHQILTGFDGIDQSALLRNGSSTEALGRQRVVAQSDGLQNCHTIRSGDWKLLLGPCGPRHVFTEPSGTLAQDGPLSARIVERATDALDWLLGHENAFFFDYVIVIQYYGLLDLIFRTEYTNSLTAPIISSTKPFAAPEVASFSPKQVQLYNLKTDPSEQNNLAATHRDIVERLGRELYDELRTSNGVPQEVVGALVFGRLVRVSLIFNVVVLTLLLWLLSRVLRRIASRIFGSSKRKHTPSTTPPATMTTSAPTQNTVKVKGGKLKSK